MLKLIQIELFKLAKHPRTFIGFGAVVFIVLAFQTMMYFKGEDLSNMLLSNLQSAFEFTGNIINANILTYVTLNALIIHIPILICLVTGDLISGEASSGTIRLLLQKPYSRTRIYVAKVITAVIYTLMLLAVMGLLSFSLGYLLFGNGDMLVVSDNIVVIDASDTAWRFAGAFLMGALAMLVVMSLSILLSAYSSNSIVPIVGTIAIIIVLNVLSVLGYSLFKDIIPYLFTNHFNKWQLFFSYELKTTEIIKSIAIQLSYVAVFLTAGYVHFKNKDILN
ncbi:MAG: hypothetical protein AUK44_10740 [Porphyromonadaceae bacterium CG2_30_38_12]|nr:MAG: hypothetical protein AUK44_10740 [Porphyromonadaceae bacterium CG2_30_38_12]